MRIATNGLDATIPHVLNADTFGDSDRDDVLGRDGKGVKGCLPVGDDADGADGRVEAEVTEKFGQTLEIRFRRNHDVQKVRHTYLYDHTVPTNQRLSGAREENRTPDLRITSANCSDSGGRVGTFAIVKAKSFGCVSSVWTSVDISRRRRTYYEVATEN